VKRLKRVLVTVVLAPVAVVLLIEVLLRGEWELIGEELRKRGRL